MSTLEHSRKFDGNAGTTGEPASAAAPQAGAKADHRRGLLLVGLFKLSKAVFFVAVGAGALHLLHKDIGEVVLNLASALRLDSESRLVGFLITKSYMIHHHELRRGALYSFLYAGLCLVEGTGLILGKAWAEYFTVTLTLAALPWEAYELIKKFTWFKVGLVVVNIAVLLYLLWVLKRKRTPEA